MNRLRVSITGFLSFIAMVSPSLLWTTVSLSEEGPGRQNESANAALELLQAEVLDTVLLDRAVHFTTPETTDTVASPETYRVLAVAQNQLKLVSSTGKHVLVIEALSTTHHEDLASPVALYIRDDAKFPHVVLLLPDGTGLEAVGSYDVIRSRGMRTSQLRPIQILSALKKKLQMKGN